MDVWNYNDYNGMYDTTQSRPNQPRPPLLCFGSRAFRPSLAAPLDRIRQRGILVSLTNLQLVNLIVIHHRVAAGSVFVSIVACQVTRMVPLVIGGEEACAFYWFSALRRGAQRAAGTQQGVSAMYWILDSQKGPTWLHGSATGSTACPRARRNYRLRTLASIGNKRNKHDAISPSTVRPVTILRTSQSVFHIVGTTVTNSYKYLNEESDERGDPLLAKTSPSSPTRKA
jgi:hypothetical protein